MSNATPTHPGERSDTTDLETEKTIRERLACAAKEAKTDAVKSVTSIRKKLQHLKPH